MQGTGNIDAPIKDYPCMPSPSFQPRRSNRVSLPFTWYYPNEFVMLSKGGEPDCYEEAIKSDYR